MTVELFAGAGGASLGLLAAGCEEVRAVEFDANACATRRAAGLRTDEGDVRDPAHYAGLGDVGLLWSSFPCQAWSSAGKRLGAADERNGWPWTVDVLDRVKPRWFIAENVPGLTHHRGDCDRSGAPESCPGCYFERRILPDVAARFAWSSWTILDSVNYGVPQRRRRVYIVGGPWPLRWPQPTHADPDTLRQGAMFGPALLPWRTVREVLGLNNPVRHRDTSGWARPMLDDPGPAVGTKGTIFEEDPKHPHARPDAPAPALRSGGAGHSAPPMWLNSSQTSGRKAGRAPCASSVDAPAPTVRANEGTGLALRTVGYRCPKPADGPRTTKDGIGKVLSFAPCDDACTICDHCGEHIDDHGRPAIMREDPSRGWEAHGIDEPSPAVRAGRPGGGLGTRAASRPGLLDKPSPTVMAVGECKGSGDGGNPEKMRRASDALWLGAGIRRLTVAECAALMSWPDGYPLQGTKTSQYAQVGNGCTPPVVEALARAVIAADKERP